MRKVLILGVLVAIVTMLHSCTSTPTEPTSVEVLVDNTDKMPSRENQLPAQKLVNMVGYEGSITFRQLNNVSINTDTTISISLPSDPTSRQKKLALKPFVKELDVLRKEFLGANNTEVPNSSLYKPICEILRSLQSNTASVKTLIVVSDMVENSQYANFYHAKGKPQEVAECLEKAAQESLPASKDVEVIIVYDPKGSTKHEKEFDRAMEIWGCMFKKAGISFTHRANL